MVKELTSKYMGKYKCMSPAVKAGIWFTICNILQRGIQFLTTPIYTRLLTTEEYGMYSVFITWLNIFTVFATLNLSSGTYYNGMLKYKNRGDEYTSAIQSLGSLQTIIVGALFTCGYPVIGIFIGLPYSTSILMFAIAFVHPAFLFWSVQQRLKYKYKALIVVTVINALLAPVVGIFFVAKLGLDYRGIVWGYVISNLLVCSIFYIQNLFRGKKVYVKEYWHYALKLSIPLVPHYLSQMVLGQSDRVMIRYFSGASDAGIYSLAYQVSLIMNLLTSGINNSLTPWMYRCLKEKAYHKIKKSTMQLVLLVAVLSGMAMLIAPEIVSILGTKEYLQAMWIIPPIMFSTCIMFVYCVWGTVLFFFEKTKLVALATSGGAILNVVLNALFIPRWGFIAAAYTTLAGYLVICLMYYYFTKRVCEERGIEINKLFDMGKTIIILCCLLAVFVLALLLYKLNVIVRYSLLFISLVAMVTNRNRISDLVKSIR